MSQSKKQLASSATDKIRHYLLSQVSEEGGFCNRRGESDLYYTLFGLFCSIVLDVNLSLSQLEKYLDRFEVESLSLVHLTCLVKCRVLLKLLKGFLLTQEEIERLGVAINKFRTENGSFSYDGKGRGFPYAAFLALNFYQDLGFEVPNAKKLLNVMENYRTVEGAFHNPDGTNKGMLLSTVAAVQVIRYLTERIEMDSLDWIKSQYQSIGGFCASPESQFPDMLSSAVALFTLAGCAQPLQSLKGPASRFIEDHWDDCGGFRATLLDDVCDCEYTYYGLLALGALHDNNLK